MTSFDTPLCDVLGLEVPIVQAPIGRASTPDLAVGVADAGGLGLLSATFRSVEETRDAIREALDRTDGAVGVNLVLHPGAVRTPTDEHLTTCLEAGAEIVSLSFGEAAPYVDRIHDAGARVLQTVCSAQEAREAAVAGVDVVVSQGWEAGGQVQSEVATMPLVPRVADAVDVPVVAAGGIGDGRGIAAALALGADGAWLGTRFLAAEEADLAPPYRERVIDAEETDTIYSELFDGGWPGTHHRTLRNSTVERWEAAGRPASGSRPGEGEVVGTRPDGRPVKRYSAVLPTEGVEGDVEAMAMYAGQSVGLTDEVRSADDVVGELVAETGDAVERLDGLLG